MKENIQTSNTQNERPELVQITSLQTKENDSDLNPVIPVVVRPAMEESPNKPVVNAPVSVDARNETNRFAESAKKKRAAQASLIESFKKKKKECPEVRNENLYLDSDGDLVEMVSSRSPSAQTRSPCRSDRSDHSSANSSEGQTISKPICQNLGTSS